MKRWILWCVGPATLLAIYGLTVAGYWAFGWGRVPPGEKTWQPAEGIQCQRLIRKSPRLVVIHVVTVDLRLHAKHLWSTPPDHPGHDRPFQARTTSQAAKEFGLVVALNGDYFEPYHNRGVFDYFPHAGDAVRPMGPSRLDDKLYHPKNPGYFARRGCTVLAGDDGTLRTNVDLSGAWFAISGGPLLLRGGRIGDCPAHQPDAQSALAWSNPKKVMWLIAVDGRQPNYSEGLTDRELAEWILELGAEDAIKLDGGGSTTLVSHDSDGGPRVINCPIHCGILDFERPVANHVGLKIR